MGKVSELPTGEYDAVRTLRHLLSQAEAGEFNNVLVICNQDRDDDKEGEIWASWSDMNVRHVWWLSGWLTSYLCRRYFSGIGIVEDTL